MAKWSFVIIASVDIIDLLANQM